MPEEKFVYTACPGWGDHDYCALKTVVKDGVIDHTEKVVYGGYEACEGHICQKGILSCRQPYNPDRLMKPLKRVGERGEGKWEEISWDQALDEIAAKLAEIRDKYGSESVALWALLASIPPTLGLNVLLTHRFIAAFGATDPLHRGGLDNGAQFTLETDVGNNLKYLSWDPRIMDDSTLVLAWGCNPIENQMRVAMPMVEARDRGVKIIDIGLAFDGTAAFADQFVPVRPGSDAALALGIAHVLVKESLCDYEYLINRTVAPFLVSDEDGKFVRNEDGYTVVWDTAEGGPAIAPPGYYDLPVDTTALEGEFEAFGVKCKPVFTLLKEHLELYTPEYQETITGVPADVCIDLAHEIGAHQKIFFGTAYGMRYLNQGRSHRAVTLLAALRGTLGVDGGAVGMSMVTSSWPVTYNTLAVVAPRGIDESDHIIGANYCTTAEFYEGAKQGKYKALITMAGNPVHNIANRGRWVDETIPNLELLVDFDIWMTDTSEMADYVLPDCMPFESVNIINSGAYGHVVLQQPAIEPVADAHSPCYFLSGLAERLGIGEYFQDDEYGYIDKMLHLPFAYPPMDNLDPPLTIERLKEEKMVRLDFPTDEPWNPFKGAVFSTPSGRLEFYAEQFAEVGEPMATYVRSIEFPVPEDSPYPYQLFTGRQRFFMQSMFTEDPITREMAGGKPRARMNPVDATKEGIKTGDLIEVYNKRGHCEVEATLDEAIPPGTVHIWYGWRSKEYDVGSYSEMTTPCGGEESTDALADAWWEVETKDKGMQVFFMGSGDLLAGTWDTLWDAACAVRKVES